MSISLTGNVSGLIDVHVHDQVLLIGLLIHDGDLNDLPVNSRKVRYTDNKIHRDTYSVSSLEYISSPSTAS